MARTIVSISMPESARRYVESRVSDGYASVSDYFRDLIRMDQKRQAKRKPEFNRVTSINDDDGISLRDLFD